MISFISLVEPQIQKKRSIFVAKIEMKNKPALRSCQNTLERHISLIRSTHFSFPPKIKKTHDHDSKHSMTRRHSLCNIGQKNWTK